MTLTDHIRFPTQQDDLGGRACKCYPLKTLLAGVAQREYVRTATQQILRDIKH